VFLDEKTSVFYKPFINFMYILGMNENADKLKLNQNFAGASEGVLLGDRVTSIRAIGQENRFGEFTQSEARGIYIRGYGVTSATDANPVLGTRGMGPCLAVAIYNPKTKTGALAHFDTNTDTASITTLLESVRGKGDRLEVHLAGGELGSIHSHRLVDDIIARLAADKDVTFKSADILNSAGGLKALALDTRTGQVSTSFMGRQLDNGDRQNIMSFHVSRAFTREPLRPEYINGTVFSVQDWQTEIEKQKPKSSVALQPD
jgi:Protein N-terminal asparagine amidohydrolase